jgi:hypothetical protein
MYWREMPDRSHWTCPDCGEEIEGEMPVDPSFGERVEEHERQHVERQIVVELEPHVLERLRQTIERCRYRQTDDSDVDMLRDLTDRLAEGFAGKEQA